MYLVVATWSDDTRKMESFDTFDAAEARVREVLADPYIFSTNIYLYNLTICDKSGVILKHYVSYGEIWEEE